MKRQMVDYRGLSLKTIGEPRFRHLLLLLGWVGYFILYTLTENLIPPERCTPIHCGLDDLIPFNEFFLIFYCSWYVLIVAALLRTLLFDVERFKKVQLFIMITQGVAMLIYILWPSRQDLRPETFAHDNFLTTLMAFIYDFDTSTGVCPSLHVAYSLGILSAGLKDPSLKGGWKAALTVLVILICVSVCFVKQHSALDILAALPLCLLAEAILYGREYWLPRFKGLKSN